MFFNAVHSIELRSRGYPIEYVCTVWLSVWPGKVLLSKDDSTVVIALFAHVLTKYTNEGGQMNSTVWDTNLIFPTLNKDYLTNNW